MFNFYDFLLDILIVDPIKVLRSMRRCVSAILALSGAMDHGIPWYRMRSILAQWSNGWNGAMDEKKSWGVYTATPGTQQARIGFYTPPEQAVSQLDPSNQSIVMKVGSVLDFCVRSISHCAFSVFLSAWVWIPPKSHFNLHTESKYCKWGYYSSYICFSKRRFLEFYSSTDNWNDRILQQLNFSVRELRMICVGGTAVISVIIRATSQDWWNFVCWLTCLFQHVSIMDGWMRTTNIRLHV